MRKEVFIDAISYVFILLFLYTGIMKLIDYNVFHFDWINAPILKTLDPIIAFAVPITELIIAACLFIPKTRKLGLYSSLIIMTLFTIYVGGILSFAKHKPCTCGGILRELSWRQHLVVNIILTGLALTAIILSKQKKDFRPNDSQFEMSV